MIRTATAFTSAVPTGAKNQPDAERHQRDRQHRHGEITAHHVGQARHRSFRALRLLDQLDDLRESRVAPDLCRLEVKCAGPVDSAAVDRRARTLGDGQALAGEHRFIDLARAFENHAIDGYAVAGTHHRPGLSAELRPAGLPPRRRCGSHARVAEAADCIRRRMASDALPRARASSSAAQENQHHDDGGGFEVDVRSAGCDHKVNRETPRRYRARSACSCWRKRGAGRSRHRERIRGPA